MQHALKRLLELRDELEQLHRTTERVLAESEQLISRMNGSEPQAVPPPPHSPRRRMPPRKKARPRSK